MRPLSAQDILRVWEIGRACHPVDRALLLLAASFPEASGEVLADLGIGERDARLLHVRALTFGERLSCFAECPHCSATLEFELSAAEVRALAPPAERHDAYEAAEDNLILKFRLPTSRDLASVAACADIEAARHLLARRCLLEGRLDGVPVELGELPGALLNRLSACMAACDPAAEVEFELVCPACGKRWQGLFDIAGFFWREIVARAKRLLRDVHVLARAYGWTEDVILSLSDARRQAYIEMVTYA